MGSGHFYVRVLMDQVPEERRTALALRIDRNYPVLDVDGEKNRLLIHDDQMKMLWIPMSVCRFVRLS